MNVRILGAGNVGRAFAKRLAAAGHHVAITARDPAHAAFNTVFAQVLGIDARAQVLYAGDAPGAKGAVRALIESAGFEAVDAGPLANARALEPLGLPNIYLGHEGGRGTGVAPAWQQVA